MRYETAPLVSLSPDWPGQTCQTGARALGVVLGERWPELRSGGCFHARPVAGSRPPRWSWHARGAALDRMANASVPREKRLADELCSALVEHHEVLGVMRIIWAGRTWTSDNLSLPILGRWRLTPRAGHHDHVHLELTTAAAATLTVAAVRAVLGLAEPEPPAPPPVPPALEVDMRILVETDRADQATWLVGDYRRRIATTAELAELERLFGARQTTVSAVVRAFPLAPGTPEWP